MNDTVWVTKLGLAVVAVVLVMVTSRYVSSVYSVGNKTAFAVSTRSLQHLTKPWRCHRDTRETLNALKTRERLGKRRSSDIPVTDW
jgi:hypothetical protein